MTLAQVKEDTAITMETGFPHLRPWQTVLSRNRIRHQYQNFQSLSLPRLLMDSRHLHCTDPRDKIYALAAIHKQGQEDFDIFRPDYSATVAEVYTKATVNIIERYQSLDILSFCSCFDSPSQSESPNGLPTWVPHLFYPSDRQALYTGVFG